MVKILLLDFFLNCIILNVQCQDLIEVNKSPKVKESIDKWKLDSTGCHHIRTEELFYSNFDSIQLKNLKNIREYFGKPNLKIDTSFGLESYITFTYYFQATCRNGKKGSLYNEVIIGFTKKDEMIYREPIIFHYCE